MTDLKAIAATAEQVVESIVKIEPIAMTLASFIPGAAPVMAIVHPAVVVAAPYIERALNDIAAGNNGDVLSAFIELLQHVTKGQSNSPVLSQAPTPAVTPG